MQSVNKVTLMGNLGRDPETRTFENGGMVVTFSLATTDSYWDREKSQRVDLPTEWHYIRISKNGLTKLAQYLTKGSHVYVEGSIRTRQYVNKDNENKQITEIHVDELIILNSRNNNSTDKVIQTPEPAVAIPEPDGDLPF
ncbi:MAG: single-stranded DNA-binding protein [Flavobacteriales bacterium]